MTTLNPRETGIVRRPPFGSNPLVGERGSDTRNRIIEAAFEEGLMASLHALAPDWDFGMRSGVIASL